MLATAPKASRPSIGAAFFAGSSFAWKQIKELAGPFLKQVADRMAAQVKAFDPALTAYAEYALTNQGKQLRPVLVGLSAGATGPIQPSHVTLAVIIETVHLATLVHDDVMDEATIRRGRPTVAARWGNDLSVLLGDCLFAHALKLAAGFPTTDVCRAVSGSTLTVCTGEIIQNKRRGNFQLSRAEYFNVLGMKTGELFALACEMGAFLNGAPKATQNALRQYGMNLGTAYQMFDDCMDVFGTEATAGKSLGTDLAKGKLTLPVLLLLERLPPQERAALQEALGQWEPKKLPWLLGLLKEHNALKESQLLIHDYLNSGRQHLAALPDSPHRQALGALADFLAAQTDALGGS